METRDEILALLAKQESDGVAYWNAFDLAAFHATIGTAWSPAENVRHLTKSIRPVTKALKMPRIVLRFMFGKAKRPSMSYDALVARYASALADGGKAGKFSPSQRSESDLEAWRKSIIAQYEVACRELRDAVARWPEKKLDALQLPHPLLGNLTIREMLFFTLYHQRHHQNGVEKRLSALQP